MNLGVGEPLFKENCPSSGVYSPGTFVPIERKIRGVGPGGIQERPVNVGTGDQLIGVDPGLNLAGPPDHGRRAGVALVAGGLGFAERSRRALVPRLVARLQHPVRQVEPRPII